MGSSGTVTQYPGTRVIQCTLNRQKPVKAAIIVFDHQLRVVHDPQLVTETESTAILVNGNTKVGVMSVYFEGEADIESNILRVRAVCARLNTDKVLIGGDVNAWSHWWGSAAENQRGEAYSNFLNEMDFHILNTGDTPTFEEYRQGRLCTSIVDVTACSAALLGKIKGWRVDRTLTTSDHNAITYTLVLGERLIPAARPTTRRYNTKKAKWSEFDRHLHTSLAEKDISVGRIEAVTAEQELESIIQAYTEAIQAACEIAIPKIGSRKGKSSPPWWSEALENKKKEVLRKKRRLRNAAPLRKESVLHDYLRAKEEYAQMSTEAQTESWKEFCTAQERESMWDGIYRVIRRTTERKEDVLLRGSDGKTLGPQQSADLLAETFYPDDSVDNDKPYHTQARTLARCRLLEHPEELAADDPPFTVAELEAVLRAQNPKKAPGPDGFTADICARAIRRDREVFMAIANKCLAIPHFPKRWKVAHVVILSKPGKDDYTHPKAYRPIGLLSILGKTVEKLIVGRLQWHLLPTLSPKQYGFTPQRGTDDALYDLMRHVRAEVSAKKSAIVVSLDIEGAFDNAWWPALLNRLAAKRCPGNLYRAVNSYLSDRKVLVNYAGATSERGTTKGCVQGSIGGPTFWNLILDPLLHSLTREGVHCQAFADDVVLVFSGKSIPELEDLINPVLAEIVEWGAKNKLTFAAHKTQVMLLTKKLKFDPPEITMSGTPLALVDEIKLLGLTIDRNLNFNKHVSNVCKKSTDIYKQLACAAKVTWGLNGEIVRTIYTAVIEPIVTYGACAWDKATELTKNRKKLDALQRNFAQKVCKAYRTTSLTSTSILAGILPLDLRIQEVATLYRAKRGISSDFLPPGCHLEQKVEYKHLPHPSTHTSVEFELLEDMSPQTQETLRIAGPQIYTDGSKMEGKVGAALTWWENGREALHELYSLDPTCTVFQSELYALHRAVLRARASSERLVNILSDSRSSLEMLSGPKLYHPLAVAIVKGIGDIRAEGRDVRLFWLRAHVGTEGNERADELAKEAAARGGPALDYAEVPLSHVRSRIREETVRKWQDRVDSSQTGSVTKMFLPDVEKAYRIVRGTKLTPLQVQILTGHGGFGEYLHRFKLKDSPGCECDPNKSESVWHLLLECPRFTALRFNLECSTNTQIQTEHLSRLLEEPRTRSALLSYIERVARVATSGNSSRAPMGVSQTVESNPHHSNEPDMSHNHTQVHTSPTSHTHTQTHTIAHNRNQHASFEILQCAEEGHPGIRLRGVALFMDNNTERVGIAFCNAMARNTVRISPGLGALLNGSTFRTAMRRKAYEALPEVTVEGQTCRIVRKSNKTIALFCTEDDTTEFAQVCSVLTRIGAGSGETPSRKISVDAMVVGFEKGETNDYVGALAASKHHEVVMYEDRGQNLSFLVQTPRRHDDTQIPMDSWGHPIPNPSQSGSERLQDRMGKEGSQAQQRDGGGDKDRKRSLLTSTLSRAVQAVSRVVKQKVDRLKHTAGLEAAVERFTAGPSTRKESAPKTPRTRADKGQVAPPQLRPAKEPRDHWQNALTEFVAVTKATQVVNTDTCRSILQTYMRGNEGLLRAKLGDAEAAIYNNDTGQVLHGEMSGSYMAAYGAVSGFVERDEERSELEERDCFDTAPEDAVVVVARCTRVMIDGKILEMAEATERTMSSSEALGRWTAPAIAWVNGVPGGGKTTWVVKNFDPEGDLVVTTTREAAKNLKEHLERKVGKSQANRRVRTLASLLVNGKQRGDSCKRLVVDEALMNHFGSIVMAMEIVKADSLLLLGDTNQLPFIDRHNLFTLHYNTPQKLTKLTEEWRCTHRNPMDVAYALNEVYSGIYSSGSRVRSLSLRRFTGERIPKGDNTLYLVHTQAEKALLISQGYGSSSGSQTLTIHEAQGLTCETVVIVSPTPFQKVPILNSIPHAVVAISRHTKTCVYYTDRTKDNAIARLMMRADRASEKAIMDYTLKMAMRDGNETVRDNVASSLRGS